MQPQSISIGTEEYLRLIAAEQRSNQAEALASAALVALDISPDDVGRIMHESWSRTKRAQGFHGRREDCTSDLFTMRVRCGIATGYDYPYGAGSDRRCTKFHPDLIPWEELPQGQKDLNLHAFDDVLAEMKRRVNPDAAMLLARHRADVAIREAAEAYRNWWLNNLPVPYSRVMDGIEAALAARRALDAPPAS